ncbi:MAG: hypothetical protein EXX96DRAFT_643729 [Benjaminiella poitrasii]|nr:MAG: hypothetical protein EXX96DRAFT_643729 [Benjaminiella poitrasii]
MGAEYADSDMDVPTQKGLSVTILGAVFIHVSINISMRDFVPSGTKKRKIPEATTTISNKVKETKAEHFFNSVVSVLDTLDIYDMQSYYIVIDNSSNHTSSLL